MRMYEHHGLSSMVLMKSVRSLRGVCHYCRAVPNKRGVAAVATVAGSTFSGLVRYFFGRWVPTFEQLMRSKVPPMPYPAQIS